MLEPLGLTYPQYLVLATLRKHATQIYGAICQTFDFSPERAREALEVLDHIVARANRAEILPA